VARAERQTVEDRVVVVATLESKDTITVLSELDATVKEIAFSEGQAVRRGDSLIFLDDVRTRAELDEAEAGFRLAELSFNRNKELLDNQTISQQEYDQAEASYYDRKATLELARDLHENTVIAAPFSGLVGERDVSVGQFVTRGERLTRLMSMDPLEMVFDVPERHLGRLKAGLGVSFTADAMSDERFAGRVTYIAPRVSPRTRSVRVKAEVPNEDGRLKPGMFGDLALVLERRDDAVVIPESSIKIMGGAKMVVIVNGDGKAEFRPVRTGLRARGSAEVIEGLTAGELILVEGHQKVFGPGMTVVAAPESAEYGVDPGPLGSVGPGHGPDDGAAGGDDADL
jgi:membrane fusion protein (multidrug efflux system)